MGYESFEVEDLQLTKDTTQISDISELEQGLTLEHIISGNETGEAFENTERIIGNPEEDMENWHLQDDDKSCAVCCQEFIAEQLLGNEFSEEQFTEFAKKNGWYDAETGTSLFDIGKILETCGLCVERTVGATLNDLAEDLKNGNKLICAVNAGILDNPEYAKIPGIKANHAVQVIGIDMSNPDDIKIVLNDPGVSEGKGRVVSADSFVKAWNTGKNFVATVNKEV